MTEQRTNWAGNYTYTAREFHYPQTLADLQKLVSQSSLVKVLGSGHSFNHIADTAGDMISLSQLPASVDIDKEQQTVTVSAGFKYGQICQQLYEAGYALHNLASLPHISVAGAVATATHGSGDQNGSLATAVTAVELVLADGSIMNLSRDHHGDDFPGVVVGLGGLGVVTKLTLKLLERFDVRQAVYQNLPFDAIAQHFDGITSKAYSVSMFTDWSSESINQVWLKHQVTPGEQFEFEPNLFGATLSPTKLHPIGSQPAEAATDQLGIPGPWYARLPHFKMEFTPSSGEELQTEYLVPRAQAVTALQRLNDLREKIAPLIQISEVRTIAADDLWISPFYQQARVALHFTWVKDWEAVRQLLPIIEEQLVPLGAVPHWGKLFTVPAEQIQSQYAKLPDFQRLLHSYDPQGKFRNAFLDQYIYGR